MPSSLEWDKLPRFLTNTGGNKGIGLSVALLASILLEISSSSMSLVFWLVTEEAGEGHGSFPMHFSLASQASTLDSSPLMGDTQQISLPTMPPRGYTELPTIKSGLLLCVFLSWLAFELMASSYGLPQGQELCVLLNEASFQLLHTSTD